MCGRARLSSDVSEIKLVFSIPPHRPTPNFPPSWNVAPTDSLPVIRYDAIGWKGRYRLEGPAFVYVDQDTGRVATILGYPTDKLSQIG